MTTYTQLINKLFSVSLHGGIKLGLDNCNRLNAALGYPDRHFASIHVAGTNGKGSVTKKIAAGLEHEGYKTGHYTSPHISCFRERIRINGEMITEQSVEELLPKVFYAAEALQVPATFFELTTLLAFLYFAKQQVDFAVLETGLGGRLDATNIISPKLTVITSITLEHTDILGKTVEEIAQEKAGIIKPNVPVVLGPRLPHQLFKQRAIENNCPCISVEGGYSNFDDENKAVAKTALELLGVSNEAITYGLSAQLPCRIEQVTSQEKASQCIILDVAHNPDGLHHLFAAIRQRWPNKFIRVICGLSKTKDIPKCVQILQKNAGRFHLVEAPNGRGILTEDLRRHLLAEHVADRLITIDNSITVSIHRALLEASENEIILICGTFFIMSEARAALGIDEPRDFIDMNERSTYSQ